MVDMKRVKKAGSLVALGLVTYFSVRYYDKILSFPSPWDIIILLIAVIFLWAVTYYALGIKN